MKKIKWRNLKLGLKYMAALFTAVMLFVAATGLVSTYLFQNREAVSVIEATADRSVMLTHMMSLFITKQAIASNYVNSPQNRLIDEYDKIKKEFEELEAQMIPVLDTSELRLDFDIISKNNKQIDDYFKSDIVKNMEQNNIEDAIYGQVKISALLIPTTQVFEKIRVEVDMQRHKSLMDTYKKIDESIKILIISTALATVVGISIVLLISRSISSHLNQVVKMMSKIAKGELDLEEIYYQGRDEIGQLSSAMNEMLHSLRNMIQEIAVSATDIDNRTDSLRLVAVQVKQGSEQITVTMEEMSAGVEAQANSSNEIANSIFNLGKLIMRANETREELENSSEDIIGVVQNGNVQMKISVNNMIHINSIIGDAVKKIKQLDVNSKKISTLVQVINSIAEQTNLLALNAAIEAARAGEAGKGFAVVSEEIRKLAEQVGGSVKEITNIVLGIQSESKLMAESLEKGYGEIENGTYQIKTTGEIFERINNEVITMTEKIKQISENLNEISENGNAVNAEIEQITAISEENSAGIEETVASIQQQNSSIEMIEQNTYSLLNASKILKEIVSQFQL
ncbi:methyl-accepting chemotaxis protein [Geosporobacter ferrireducens]|uniref:Chemotaxis protein n=1 Tax=Geosporobacter ferrireducens TaxID=1424294 RepID=A0A1D8GFY7_9FIRM|nr:HAMP domain-containing methyl-accepting chemotaxis protein [Geosporobacter ferrireducens]AOT69826.1 hypothetical protein Gferi_09680 [Geosporobacter ferrireducens]